MDVIIETPKGSQVKYAWDKKAKTCRAKKLLADGLSFPYDFGFIPDTTGEDGDPLDVMVVSEFSTYPGSVMDVRIIGCIKVKQAAHPPLIQNDRYIAVPSISRDFDSITQLYQLPDFLLQEITGFLRAYIEAEGKKINIEGFLNADESLSRIGAEIDGNWTKLVARIF